MLYYTESNGSTGFVKPGSYINLKMTHTYPVLIKLWENRDYLFNSALNLNVLKAGNEDLESFRKRIINEIMLKVREIYATKNVVNELNYEGCKLKTIEYNGYYFLFLVSSEDLIFLNYTHVNEAFNDYNWIIPKFTSNRDKHIYYIGNYMVINTYEPFVEYSRVKLDATSIELRRNFNFDFFPAFFKASQNDNRMINGNLGVCYEKREPNRFFSHEFSYYLVNNIIIIKEFK